MAEIADVKRQIITPRLSTPIIGITQDGLLGAYNLTAPNMKIEWKDAMNMISYTSFDKLDTFKKNTEYKGSDLFSLIIPSDINTSGKVEIKKGHIISGQIKADQLGSKKQDSLIHMIYDQHGMDETKGFIDNTVRLVMNFNLYNGFTVGVGDIYIPPELEQQMNKLFETKKLEVNHIITEMENNPDLYDPDTFEQSIYGDLNNIRETVSQLIMNNLTPDNKFNILISSGAKGAPVNMGQMGGCVGQQAVEGRRIVKRINGRTLPYFYQNDDSATGRGFVEEPFIFGMTPQSFIFHNMSSREGLIDTAIKTAESGYIQRKLIKSMEDAMVKYDLTVRNSNNTILQFSYGDNGIDTTRQSKHTLQIIMMGNKEIEEKYKFTNQELKNFPSFSSKDNDNYFNQLLKMRDQLRHLIRAATISYIKMKDNFPLPADIKRIINNAKNSDLTSKEKLEPKYILEKLDDLIKHTNTKLFAMSKQSASDEHSLKYKDELESKTIFKIALHEYMSPKILIFKHNLNKAQFDDVYEKIITSFNRSVIEAGEMAGVIAGQSIGEPVTQIKVV